MFPINPSQRAAFAGLRREFEKGIGLQPELPRNVAIFDSPTALTVEIDLPGIAKSDVELMLEQGVLRIRAERKEPEFESSEGQDFRSYGKLEHVFRLGFAVDPSGLDAVFEDGVLRVKLAKAPESQPTRIEVRPRPEEQN